jgi:hypothetical protein
VTRPWATLPRAFAAEVRKERGSISTEILHQIRREIPEYDKPLSGKFGIGLQLGVETALLEFPELVESAGEPTAERLRVYRALGRGELAEGRSLDALQAAYRLGGRVAWRRYARVGRRAGMRADEMVTLAEAIFAHIDVMASAATLGYAEAKTSRDSDDGASSRRRMLRDLLVAGVSTDQLEQLAPAARWPLPERVSCVALGAPPPSRTPANHISGLPGGVLYDLDCQNPYLVLRDPGEDLRDELLLGLLRDRGAVVGPAVPPTMAPDSLRWARRLRDRLPAPALAKAPIMCDHALPSVLLLGDEPLLKLLADRRLAALADLTVKQRRRMETTLLAWLDTNGGSAPQIAARLGIHPQTARQRLHRLHELFGPVFADPDARFELELALRGRHALSALGRQQ